MSQWLRYPIDLARRFFHSIAYYPTLLSLIYLLLAITLIELPDYPTRDMLSAAPDKLLFNDLETPRSLLSSMISSIISLAVFSFSTVMVVLSQAASNYSLKLMFGLMTARFHQMVLGNYLGTIVYSLVLLTGLGNADSVTIWASMGVYLGIAMTLLCMALFVYFIHHTSRSIEVNTVTSSLGTRTRRSLHRASERYSDGHYRQVLPTPQPSEQAHRICARSSGYVQSAALSSLGKVAQTHDGTLHIDFTFGSFVVEGQVVMRWSGPLPEADENQTREAAVSTFEGQLIQELNYLEGESIELRYAYGFTQLMETAIKALSPGINAPGTALLCINQLTDLLSRRQQLEVPNAWQDNEGTTRVVWDEVSFEDLLYRSVGPILDYGHQDISVCLSLLALLRALANTDTDEAGLTALQGHADRVMAALNKMTLYPVDRRFIEARLGSGGSRLYLPNHLAPSEAIRE
ncbi:DUF2254 domain-containing protein [Kushneria phosphatilytica]|uniref:DUF2254 domain-containing protein n=1 Tax=Kushneria phosphatilytica TaxID=657387 RepID=A0A1S1NVJ6_9GAMM|nr:DUF2254 domain-containing protein [Kushneria phosphatilytica]OHV10607.1 hypothetical protein BH688_09545 [Kushneria phosphatilytica]QEL11812.1 DUF2254 domain-containing protein [Kushneria phosphatilytica]